MNKFIRPLVLFAMLFLASCADTNTALFVTNTSLGIDFDSKPPTGSIGYNRVEGYIGPRYELGVVPPVVAALESDNSLLRGNIRQVYATGKAATLVARKATSSDSVESDQKLRGNGQLMFFGTSTSVGLTVGFSAEGFPDRFNFGYKRKEVSVLPLASGMDADGPFHHYPSVIASIDTTGAANSQPNETGLSIMQFFGTGEAAESLALNRKIQEAFEDRAESSLAKYRQAVSEQNQAAVDLLACYQAIRFDDLPKVWEDALNHGLFDTEGNLEAMERLHNEALEAQNSGNLSLREDRLVIANNTYANFMAIDRGAEPTRTASLKSHRDFVCNLARETFPS